MKARLGKLGRRARAPDSVLRPQEHGIRRTGNNADAREALSAVWAYINAHVSGTGSARDYHPLAARVGWCADMLFDEIGHELSQDGVLVHRFPRLFAEMPRGNLRTLNSGKP